jgi:CheY-like chemotaxis protein
MRPYFIARDEAAREASASASTTEVRVLTRISAPRDRCAPLSVLVIDQVEETGEVLRAALDGRVRVLSAGKAREGLEMAREHHPDLIVLDLELARGTSTAEDFRAETASGDAPLVLLGSARRSLPARPQEFMAKPYHYGSLVRKIEELLEEGGARAQGKIPEASPRSA